MNLRKSILSLAAIVALGNVAVADDSATYMPLASKTADSMWILFGVNGFSDGTPSNAGTAASSFSGGLDSLEDTVVDDDKATEGLNGWASLQALADSPVTITSLKVGIATNGTPDSTEPMRSMYIEVASSPISQPNVKLNYRASLEGQNIEILLNGALYKTTISQDATWAHPAIATSGATDNGTSKKTAITDVLDFDFSDNPVNAKNFDATKNLDTTGVTASFFHFNAITQQWEVYQKGAPQDAQDFKTFSVGKAYWGRADKSDALGSQTIDNDGAVGLVLGKASSVNNLPDPNRYEDDKNVSTLTTGWNMLSFDDSAPYIRHAATGLVLTGVANNDEIEVTDSSGLNKIHLVAIADSGSEKDCEAMNVQIESAKLRGLLPTSFNIKFFRGDADGTIIVLSDAKFIIENMIDGAIAVKTLFNQNPYLYSTNIQGAVSDLRDKSMPGQVAVSVYGEYSEMLNVLVGDTSSAPADQVGTVDGGFAKIIYTDADGETPDTARTITTGGHSDLATAATQIDAMGVTVHPRATQIDTNFDGTADKLIVASSKPFSVEDATYIRAFGFTPQTTGSDKVINVDAGAGTTVTVASGDDVTTVAGNIDGSITNLHAAKDSGADTILAAYTGSSTFDIKDIASGTVGVLKETRTATDDVMKGAISGVYALDTMARLPLNQVTVTSTGGFKTDATPTMMDATDTYKFDGTYADGRALTVAATAAGADVTTWGAYKDLLDKIVKSINDQISSDNKHAYASHNLDLAVEGKAATDALDASKPYTHTITITGVDIATGGITLKDDDGAGGTSGIDPHAVSSIDDATGTVTGDNKLAIGSGSITTDLRTNPAYTPNYAIYGPLYTLHNSGTGYSVKAMLKATTEMDNTSGAIAWDSIDVTRKESDWFAHNEFNLFNINSNSGYWVYLEDKAAKDSVAIDANATFTPAYTYYFDNTLNSGEYDTKNVINSGQLQISITGLDDVVAGSAYAIIGAEEIRLKRNGTTNIFSATISDYGLQSFAEGGPVDVKVRAVNGKGEAVSASSVVTIDYMAPTHPAATIASVDGAVNLTLSADANTTKQFYVFKDYIPELKSARVTALSGTTPTAFEVNATSSSATFNACSKYDFGVINTLRIVAADGDIDTSNLSNQIEIKYASLLRGATVLAHDPSGSDKKAQIGKVYNDACTPTTQTTASQNAGVSIASLDTNNVKVAAISFQAIAGSTFDQSTAWTSLYETANGAGAVVQIQNTPEYAGKTFFVEYDGKIYQGAFPANKTAADDSIGNSPIDLTIFNSVANTTLTH